MYLVKPGKNIRKREKKCLTCKLKLKLKKNE